MTQLKRKIDACANRIAAERDKLRDLANEAEIMADSADEAVESLKSAVDTLSEYL